MEVFRKVVLVLFVLFDLQAECFGQFFGLRSRKDFEYVNVLRYPLDSKIRVVGYVPSIPADTAGDTKILVFDRWHKLIDSIAYPRGIFPGFRNPLRVNNLVYWAVWMRDTNNWSASAATFAGAIMVLDTNLKFLSLKRLTHFMNFANAGYGPPILLYKDKFLYYAGLAGSKLYKVDHSLSKYDSIKIVNLQDVAIGADYKISMIIDGNSGTPTCAVNGGNRKVVMDTNFTMLDCFALQNMYYSTYFGRTLPIDGPLTTRILLLSKTRYFLSGSHKMNDLMGRCASLNAVISPSNTSLKTNLLYDVPYDLNYMDMFDYAVYNGRFVMTTGCRGRNCNLGGAVYLAAGPSKVYVNKLDTLGNIVWEREYGGNMFYGARSISFTLDSGAVIAGLRYDSTTNSNTSTSFLLQIDKFGNVIDGTEGLKEIFLHKSVSCYPIPATTEFRVDFSATEEVGDLQVIDNLGRCVISAPKYRSGSPVSAANLPIGYYCFSIRTGESFYTGKLFKE
jgi:hypothetical protein